MVIFVVLWIKVGKLLMEDLNEFIGQAKTALDEKGRTPVPREFRRLLSDEESKSLIVSFGIGESLILWTIEEYRKFVVHIETRPATPKNVNFRRLFKANSHLVSMDGQNRILLSKEDKSRAKLEGEVLYVARSGKSAELWNPAIYNSKFGFNTEEDNQEFADGLFDDVSLRGADENR